MRVPSHPQDHTPPSSPSPHLSRRSPPDTHQPKDNQKPHSVPYLDTRPTQPQQPPVQQPLAYSYSPPAYYIDSRWRPPPPTLAPAIFHPHHILSDHPAITMSHRVAESGERSSHRPSDDRTQYDIDHSPLRINHHSTSMTPIGSSSSTPPPPPPSAFYAAGPPVHPGSPYGYPPFNPRYPAEPISAPPNNLAQSYPGPIGHLSTRAIIPAYVPSQSYPGQANYVIHTDDASTKLSDRVRRKCHNCRTTDTSTWRRSNLVPGKVLCNKCGLFERTHSRPRPEQFPHKRVASNSNTPPPSSPGRLPPISTYMQSLPPPSHPLDQQQQQHHIPPLISRQDGQPHSLPQYHNHANQNNGTTESPRNGSPSFPPSRNSPEIRNLLNESAPPPPSTSVSVSSSPRPPSRRTPEPSRTSSPRVDDSGTRPGSLTAMSTPPEKLIGQKRPASPSEEDPADPSTPPSQRPRTEPRSPQYTPRAAI